jgi:hypothetical protein
MSATNQNYQKNLLEDSLSIFLHEWDKDYKLQTVRIDLFKREKVKQWSKAQRQYFIKIFYHSRGHFNNFLWHLGNYAPVLKNR